MLIAIGTILIFSPFANNVRTAAPIANMIVPIENRLVALSK